MKTILLAISALLCLTSAFADQRVDAGAWKHVQTYDASTLLSQEASLVGTIVAVRFHYRSEKLRHLAPNWYEASIWQHDPKAKGGYSALRVMIAKKDVPAFKEITSNSNSMTEVKLYGRVEKDPDNNLTHLHVFGRYAHVSTGGAIINWTNTN